MEEDKKAEGRRGERTAQKHKRKRYMKKQDHQIKKRNGAQKEKEKESKR